MSTHKSIHFNIPQKTYETLIKYARDIGEISDTNRPKAGSAVKRTMRALLALYTNKDFMEKVQEEGGDALSYIQKCVKKDLNREST